MFEDIQVKFPPIGEEQIEFQFFLEIEGNEFYKFYKKEYKKYLSEYFPEYQDTYEDYLKNFLLPHLKEFKEIRLGHDLFNGEGVWIGVDYKNNHRGVVLPKVDFDFYKGALSYRYWNNNRKE
ncbi:hypothetical protein [Bacillus mycoides]|uniref:hypothetical protein n=1 Tax=Bacillus mycoides TaxID=1405 RepID=UPI002E233AE5|nr:hypothetical protein [Bacillus mycoides]MED1054281.1 hypothetical protein [Bacillus mycoides]